MSIRNGSDCRLSHRWSVDSRDCVDRMDRAQRREHYLGAPAAKNLDRPVNHYIAGTSCSSIGY